MASTSLLNKKALVTGGGSGINFSLAKHLYERGCSVLIADLGIHASASKWFDSVKGRDGPKIVFHRVDVTSWDALEGMFDVCFKEFNDVPDIVVAGAGVYEASTAGFWNDADAASSYKLLDINLTHPIKTTRIAVRRLRQAGKPGVILHLSSITAQKPSAVLPLYSVSKAAISQFVRCMAPLEGLCGIRVVAVAPGVVDTPLFRDNPNAMQHIDMDKDFVLPPSEVVDAMAALITDTKYPSGTVLEVGDIGLWRPVDLLNDGGPQGRSTLPREKAKNAIQVVEDHLKADAESSRREDRSGLARYLPRVFKDGPRHRL